MKWPIFPPKLLRLTFVPFSISNYRSRLLVISHFKIYQNILKLILPGLLHRGVCGRHLLAQFAAPLPHAVHRSCAQLRCMISSTFWKFLFSPLSALSIKICQLLQEVFLVIILSLFLTFWIVHSFSSLPELFFSKSISYSQELSFLPYFIQVS